MPAGVFLEIDKLIKRFIWQCERPRIAKTTFEKEDQS